MRKLFLITWALIAFSLPAAAQINCHTDRRTAEQIICAHDDLMQKDERMSVLYFRLNNDVPRRVAQRLLDNQRDWLAERNACRTPGCLRLLYDQRIAQFRAVLN